MQKIFPKYATECRSLAHMHEVAAAGWREVAEARRGRGLHKQARRCDTLAAHNDQWAEQCRDRAVELDAAD